jgi:thiol:disulfide interchange protein DsbC
MKQTLIVAVVIIALFSGISLAASRSENKKVAQQKDASGPNMAVNHNCSSCHSLSKQEAATIFKGIGEVMDVKTSPLKGLYEVTVLQKDRKAVAYLDFSKKLLVPGPIFDIATKRPITPPPEELPKIIPKADLDKIPLSNSIVMGNPDGKKRMFVFTDPDCPFCGKLHGELKKLVSLEPDLTIYIKMYPLDMHPGAYDKARVILGRGSLDLLEKAFAGEKLPAPGEKDPKEPVDESIKLGTSLGVDGTPAMILPNGRMVAGTMDATKIRSLMRSKEK